MITCAFALAVVPHGRQILPGSHKAEFMRPPTMFGEYGLAARQVLTAFIARLLEFSCCLVDALVVSMPSCRQLLVLARQQPYGTRIILIVGAFRLSERL